MLLVQDFLRTHGPEALTAQFAVKVKRHARWPHLCHLIYNEYDSPMREPIVQECRGLTLDSADDYAVVARPFDKFFNHGDPTAASIDWGTARVQEKVDGSLCFLWHYAGEWQVSTKGTPGAGGTVARLHEEATGTETFADLFWRTWKALGLGSPDYALRPQNTYCCELWTPENCIQVRYPAPRIVLLAVRDRESGEYMEDEWRGERVREFAMQTVEQIEASFADVSPFAAEGYVVVDAKGQRLKVKSPQYVAMAHMREGANPKWFLDVIRRGEVPEVVVHFPDLAPQFERVRARYDALVTSLDVEYERIAAIEEQKAFALEAVKSDWSGVLFQRRKFKRTTREVLAGYVLDKLADGIGVSGAAGSA